MLKKLFSLFLILIIISSLMLNAYGVEIEEEEIEQEENVSPQGNGSSVPSYSSNDIYCGYTGAPEDPDDRLYWSTTITTTDGTLANAYYRLYDYDDTTKAELIAQMLRDMTGQSDDDTAVLFQAEQVKNSTATAYYNCHSYAWYQRCTSNQIWLLDITPFIEDVHTEELTEDAVAPGDIVVYYNGEAIKHSAVVTSINNDGTITCISKWGPLPLYIHRIDQVPKDYRDPEYGINCRYFRYTPGLHFEETYNAYGHGSCCAICDNNRGEDFEEHLIWYHDRDAHTHMLTCNECSYIKIESHALNQDRTQCVKCLRTGIFPADVLSYFDGTEMLLNNTNPCEISYTSLYF